MDSRKPNEEVGPIGGFDFLIADLKSGLEKWKRMTGE